MARADTLTMIPLDRVAYHLGIDPYHFNGLDSEYFRAGYACDDMWYQFGYQASGKLSREGLATALRQAEDVVVTHLGYTPIPQWFENEVHITPFYKVDRLRFRNSQNLAKSVVAPFGMVNEVGKKTSTLITNTATVFSDEDGDGFDETVTITFATTVTDTNELKVYYPNKSGRDEWEIRPVTSLSISGGIATIVFPKYLIALEDLLKKVPGDIVQKINIDADDNTNFLATVDVYRVYNDVSQQITFFYGPGTVCNTSNCDLNSDTGCLTIKDSRLGILAYNRADWDEDTESYTEKYFINEPVKAIIYYKSGHRDLRQEYPEWQMDRTLERLIVFYSLSLLDTELCGCSNTRNIWEKQTVDRAMATSEVRYQVLWNDLSNPLGTSTAALNLWKHIQYIREAKSPVPR